MKNLNNVKSKKKGIGLKKCLGSLSRDDKEDYIIMKELRYLYNKWTRKYFK